MRPGRQRDVGRGEDGRDGVAAADEPGEVDGQAGGLALQPGAHRALPDHYQPGVDARITQRGNGIDAAVGVLLHRKAPAVHQKGLFGPRPALSHCCRVAARVELVEVDTQRHRHDVRCVDAVELLAGERRRAYHRVVVGGGPAVGDVGDRPRHAGRKYLSDKAIEAFVGDHDRGHVVSAAPSAQRSQGQPVRDLQCVGRELFEQ